jgi:adenylate kinase family enzyme
MLGKGMGTSRRIHITGASGVGTSTLGESLAARLGYAFFDADRYYWMPTNPPFTEKRPKVDRLQMIQEDISAVSSFVLSGSICGWGGELEDGFDLIVFLQIPRELRLDRLRKREFQRYGAINQEFIDWAARYDDGDLSVRSRLLHERWLAGRECPILRLEGDLTNEERTKSVTSAAQSGATDNPPLCAVKS